MAGNNRVEAYRELQDLRAWRAFAVEAWGRVRSLESFRFALGMPVEDAMAQLGLSGSAWARERWFEMRAALDTVPDCGPDCDAALPEAA